MLVNTLSLSGTGTTIGCLKGLSAGLKSPLDQSESGIPVNNNTPAVLIGGLIAGTQIITRIIVERLVTLAISCSVKALAVSLSQVVNRIQRSLQSTTPRRSVLDFKIDIFPWIKKHKRYEYRKHTPCRLDSVAFQRRPDKL